MCRYPKTIIVIERGFYKKTSILDKLHYWACTNALCSVEDCDGYCAFHPSNHQKALQNVNFGDRNFKNIRIKNG